MCRKVKEASFGKNYIVNLFISCLVLESLLSKLNQQSSLVMGNFFILCVFYASQNVGRTFFWRNIRKFLCLGLKSSASRNVRKTFFLEKYKKFFQSGFFYFLSLGRKVAQVALYISTLAMPTKTKSIKLWETSMFIYMKEK